MFGLDNKSGINVMPPIAPADSQTPLWFTEGGAGLSATYPGQDWFNQIQAELLNVLSAGGISPEKGKLNQISLAIKSILSNGVDNKLDKSGGQMSGSINFAPNSPDAYDVISLPTGSQKKNKLRTFRGGQSETQWHEAVDGDSYTLSTGVNGDAMALSLSHGAGLRTSGRVIPGDYGNFDSRYSPDLSVPVGASIIWNSSSPIPANFWPHEGRSFSASEYPELAKILPGLKIPDDRGYGIRVADNGRGIDAGRTVGTYQEDAIQNIVGELRSESHGFVSILPIKSTGAFGMRSKGTVSIGGTGTPNPTYDFDIDASRVARTADETRMKNVAKILIMRVK
ncbi:hypothetical protein ACWQEN_002533 [Morganella morganii]